MKIALVLAVSFLFIHDARGQSAPTPPAAATQATRAPDEIEEMRADIGRLKTLVDQMRTNLAFVQTSQTPLKHQFELEADAWQETVERMERRLKRMEDGNSRPPVH